MRRLRREWILTGGALAAATAILFVADPAASHWIPPCPTYRLTGLHCPGCGTLRATHALLHGHLRAAVAYNVLWVTLIPTLAAISIPRFRPRAPWIPWAFLAILLLYAVLRNLPWWPFYLLAPHAI